MAEPAKRDAIVSSEAEQLILVNDDDQPVGFLDKAGCHDGEGILHRAFSLFIFDTEGRLLLQQRAPGKRLWPGYWSNSCCSHPRRHETMAEAVDRRLEEELGMQSDLQFLYKFSYHATFGDLGAERELCWVYIGSADQDPVVNRNEISAWRWIAADDLDAELAADPDAFTPWFKLEWSRLRDQYMRQIERLTS
ncbi:MAG: isopentenyl-diphosphate Delta-isomerase [Gammaproteobacteria bacterium]|nr:isopentenyl-diphosphate Delta-isomerase [Gammaproteobacteria bacterium]